MQVHSSLHLLISKTKAPEKMPPLDRLEDQENDVPAANANRSPCSSEDQALARRSGGQEHSFIPMLENPPKQNDCPTRNRQGGRVSFSGQNTLHGIPGLEDFSEQELVDSWYKAPDFLIFRRESFLTIDIARIDPSRIDDIEYTLRGAEHRVKEVCDRRNLLRWRARRAVMMEQEFQEGIGEVSSYRLAEEYAHVSADAVYDALNVAAIDQLQASSFRSEYLADETFSDQWIRTISLDFNKKCAPQGILNAEEQFSSQTGTCFDDSWLLDSDPKTAGAGFR